MIASTVSVVNLLAERSNQSLFEIGQKRGDYWRRGGDSNPRCLLRAHLISSQAPSTARTPLLKECNILKRHDFESRSKERELRSTFAKATADKAIKVRLVRRSLGEGGSNLPFIRDRPKAWCFSFYFEKTWKVKPDIHLLRLQDRHLGSAAGLETLKGCKVSLQHPGAGRNNRNKDL